MRSIKPNGGLTRGRGTNELQRAIWLTTVTFVTSDQHKYASDTRIERDHQDSLRVSHYLSKHFPFGLGDDLISIENGEVADNSDNVYKAEMIGERMTEELVNKSAFEYSFKRKDAVLTMTTKSTVNIENQKYNDDPQLFFQRLIVFMKEVNDAFSYELCIRPSSLFHNNGLMNKADKSSLMKVLAVIAEPCDYTECPTTSYYVVDGGWLLQQIPWTKGRTFNDTCADYAMFLMTHYGRECTVVFDGYPDFSTKDTTHIRRAKGKAYVEQYSFG